MMKKYDFLKKYISKNDLNGFYFIRIDSEEMRLAEEYLGFSFPSELRELYSQIGHGIISGPDYDGNNVLPPRIVASFYKILKDKRLSENELPFSPDGDEYWMSEMANDIIESGNLPFFEIMDGSSFMVLKPHSDNPNAVWYMGHTLIEDSLKKFIENLYFNSPVYWEDKLN